MRNESTIGMRAVLEDNRTGTIRYIGPANFKEGIWVGIELDLPLGRNDGQVQGYRYFSCRPSHGLFVHPSKVSLACGGPNIGDILLSTPVKKPLLFPSLKLETEKIIGANQKQTAHKIVNNNTTQTDFDKNPQDERNPDSSLNLKFTIERLQQKLMEREKQLEGLQQEYSSLLLRSNKLINDSNIQIRQKCKGAFLKLKELKNAFLELSEAKATSEAFYESELANLKQLLGKRDEKSNIFINSHIETNDLSKPQIENENLDSYKTWIFELRRRTRSNDHSYDVKRIRDIFSKSTAQLGGLSVHNLEKVSASLNNMVNIYSELKRSIFKEVVQK